MPQTNQPTWWYAVAGLALLICVGIGVWFSNSTPAQDPFTNGSASSSDPVGNAISELLTSGATSTSGEGFTVEVVEDPVGEVPPPPSLSRKIPATPDLDAQGRAVVVERIEKAVDALKKNPRSFADWMDLGMLRLIVKDYEGAAEAWSYAAVLSPGSVTPYGNLGDLYANYLKDYPKAEMNLRKAIANGTRVSTYYRPLFELYLNYKPTTSAAEDVLKDAIAKFPDQLDHYVLLARYYSEKNRGPDARAMYDKAIAVAQKAGNTSAVEQLKTEKASVR